MKYFRKHVAKELTGNAEFKERMDVMIARIAELYHTHAVVNMRAMSPEEYAEKHERVGKLLDCCFYEICQMNLSYVSKEGPRFMVYVKHLNEASVDLKWKIVDEFHDLAVDLHIEELMEQRAV